MNEMALVTTNGNGRGHALDHYAGRDEVRELADRLMAMHPAAKDVGIENMRAVAQLAILVDASPLPGTNEISVWKDKDGRICFGLGINYFRRKTQELGGVLWEIPPRQMNAKERDEYNIPKDVTAAICRGVRVEDMLKFRTAGFTTNEIWKMCAMTGMGTIGQNEYAKKGRPSIWSALKRAEVDLYRQLFPVMMQKVATSTVQVEEVAPAVEGKPAVSLDDINHDLYGESTLWEEGVFEAGEESEAVEGEFEEETAVNPETGEITPAADLVPMDWVGQAENAKDLDVFVSAAYQLLKQVFTDAPGVRRAYGQVCGDFKPENNRIALAAMGKLAQAIGDGVEQKAAVKLATAHFTRLLQPEPEPTGPAAQPVLITTATDYQEQ